MPLQGSRPAPAVSPSPGNPPARPLNARVVEQTSSSLILQWDFPADARSFKLYLDGTQAGVAEAPEFRISAVTTTRQFNSAVTMDAEGDFALTWTRYASGGSYDDIYLYLSTLAP